MANENDVKDIIRALVSSNKFQMTLFDLQKAYKETEGMDIPYRQMGFTSLEVYLRSIPDTVIVNGYGSSAVVTPIVTEKSQHVLELIQRSKSNSKHKPWHRPKRISRPIVVDSASTSNHSNRPVHSSPRPLMEINVPKPELPKEKANKETSSGSRTKNVDRTTSLEEEFDCLKVQKSNTALFNFECEINNYMVPLTVQENLKLLIKTKPNGICIDSLCVEYKQLFNSVLNTRKYGYFATMEMCLALPYIFKAHCNDEGNFIIYDSDNFPKHLCDKPLPEMNFRVSKFIQSNLKELIQEHDDGIWCKNLLSEYQKKYHYPINFKEFGYMTLVEMCSALPNTFHIVNVDNHDVKLFDASKPIPHISFEETENNENEEEVEKMDDKAPALPSNLPEAFIEYPNDIFPCDDTIPKQQIEEPFPEYIDVQIGEVYDPSKFWFNLESTADDLLKLMDDIAKFYSQYSQNYIMSKERYKVGFFCIFIYMGEFSRGVIVKVIGEALKVFSIDYGTVTTVGDGNIYYLHKSFSYLPRQALRGRLAFVKPSVDNEIWSRNTAQRFLKLIFDLKLVAAIINCEFMESGNHIYELALVDTRFKNDIWIHECLIAEGYAVDKSQETNAVAVESSNPLGSLAKIDNVHLYPTFEELERGLVPNGTSMFNMLDIGLDLWVILPQYFQDASVNSVTRPDDLESVNVATRAKPDIRHLLTKSSSATESLCSSPAPEALSSPPPITIKPPCPTNPISPNLLGSPNSVNSIPSYPPTPMSKVFCPLATSSVHQSPPNIEAEVRFPVPVFNNQYPPTPVSSQEYPLNPKKVLRPPPGIPLPVKPPYSTAAYFPLQQFSLVAPMTAPPLVPLGPFMPMSAPMPVFQMAHLPPNNLNAASLPFNTSFTNAGGGTDLGSKSNNAFTFVGNSRGGNCKEESQVSEFARKFVVPFEMSGQILHLINVGSDVPQLSALEVQVAFNKHENLIFLRNLALTNGIELNEMDLSKKPKNLLNELLKFKLIDSNQSFLALISIDDLEDFIIALTNYEDFKIPNIESLKLTFT